MGVGVDCGGLNEKCPSEIHTFEHLTVGWWLFREGMEPLGGAATLKEACQLGVSFGSS